MFKACKNVDHRESHRVTDWVPRCHIEQMTAGRKKKLLSNAQSITIATTGTKKVMIPEKYLSLNF